MGASADSVGRYRLLFPIGQGGMATVYIGAAEVVSDTYRFVAIKMMHPRMGAGDGEAEKQFLEEAKLAAGIRHLNVVAVHEAAADPRGAYMVMDYVEGDTLAGLLRAAQAAGAPVPLPILGRILSDALAGLHAAHELTDASGRSVNLVHRDYSPSNLLVGLDGVTRLADFGVAKAESRVSATTSGEVKGKVLYMAPEQVLGKALDRRCDVWAAGAVAWESLAGRRLHAIGDGEDMMATLYRIVAEEPPLLASVRSDLPEAIGAAIASALTRDVEQRCPTAAELRRRLLDAWRELGPLADTEEVARYVDRLAGDRLRARHQEARRALESGASSPAITGEVLRRESSPTAEPVSASASEARSVSPWRPSFALVAGAAVVAMGAAFGVLRLAQSANRDVGTAPLADVPPVASVASIAAVPPLTADAAALDREPAPSASPSPSSTPSASPLSSSAPNGVDPARHPRERRGGVSTARPSPHAGDPPALAPSPFGNR